MLLFHNAETSEILSLRKKLRKSNHHYLNPPSETNNFEFLMVNIKSQYFFRSK